MAKFALPLLLVFFTLALARVDGRNLDQELAGPKEKLCTACRQVAEQLSVFLADPEAAEQFVAVAQGALCSNLPPNVYDKCMGLVAEYVPQIIVALQGSVTPDSLCVQTKICTPAEMQEPLSATTSLAQLQGPPACDTCVMVARQLLLLLQSGKTQEQVLVVLHRACQRLKGPGVPQKCDALVEEYVPQLILLLATVTPEEACHLARYCSASALPATGLTGQLERVLMLVARKEAVDQLLDLNNAQECAACRFLISQAKKKLKDPENQVKLAVVLTEACNKVPDFAEQCKMAVVEYLPLLYANIDTILDPVKLCIKANLCEAPRPQLSLPQRLLQLPSDLKLPLSFS